MNIFKITIQRKYQDSWPVVVEHTKPGQLVTIRRQGILNINGEDDLVTLRALSSQPREYGTILGKTLFNDGIRDAFIQALASLEDSKDTEKYLHVLLYVEAEDIKELQWQKLCSPLDEDWDFLSLNQRTPFSLYIPPKTKQLFPAIGRLDLQALVVAASPSGLGKFQLEHFDVEAAVTSVKAALGDIPTDVLATVDGAVGRPTLDALMQCLTNDEKYYTLIHFVCHGKLLSNKETALYLATEDNQVAPVDTTTLIDKLTNLRRAPHFAFLSTCESASNTVEATGAMGGLAQRLVRELGIPAVVAMTDKVSIKTAQALATAFYQQLRVHGNVDLALSEATAGLQRRDDITVPALFTYLGGQPLFSDTPDRPLTPKEIKYGLDRLAKLLPERAPILCNKLNQQITVLNRTLGTETEEALKEQQKALGAINTICSEVLDLSFPVLALGTEPPAYDLRCPFQGLKPFRLEDREFFFGRDQLIAKLQEKLAQDNFLPVLGASGSGKSSLVLAGLIPALQSQPPNLQMAYMTPTSEPIAALQTSLSTFQSQNFVLVIDQFEELFTLCNDEAQRQKFIDKLISLSQQQKVIITMRADFWGECATYPKLKEMMQVRQELIAPMDSEELRSAMKDLAKKVTLRFEAGLVNSILDEVEGEPGAMPLLQHALFELWNRRHGRWLLCVEYEAIGGVKKAISQTADAVYNGLSPEEKEQVRNIFVRLTRLDEEAVQGDKQRDTRRRVELEELVSVGGEQTQIKKLVEKLAGEGARLVVTSVNSSTHREEVEVAHEALIRYWKRLQNWLNENRINLQLREKIRDAALDWNQNQRKEEYLELQGGRLGYAKELSKQPYFFNKLETEYIDACVKLRQRQHQQKWRIAWTTILSLLGFASFAVFQWRQAEIGQIKALSASSKALSLSHQELEAVTEGLQTGKKLQHSFWQAIWPDADLGNQVRGTLQNVFSEVKESNRFQVKSQLASVAFSSDDQMIVTRSLDGTVQLWKPDGMPIPWPHNGRKVSATNNNGQRFDVPVVASTDNEQILALDVDGHLVFTFRNYRRLVPISGVAFNPTEKIMALAAGDRILLLSLTGDQPLKSLQTQRGTIAALAFRADGKILITANTQVNQKQDKVGIIQLWNLEKDTLINTLEGDMGFQESVSISSDGQMVAAGGWYGATLWKSDGTWHKKLDVGYPNQVNALTFSPDGKMLATGGVNKTVKLWNMDGTLYNTFLGHNDAIWGLSFSPDGRIIASASNDNTVKLWQNDNQQNGTLLNTLIGHQSSVRSVAFSHDGKTIASASDDGIVKIWKLGGTALKALLHNDQVYAVAFSPDGKTIATTNGHGWLTLWNPDGTVQKTGQWHFGPITAVAFSPDGQMIATAAGDRQVQIWNPDGTRLRKLKGYTGEINQSEVKGVSFSPDSQIIATASVDGKLQLFNSADGKLLKTLDQENYPIWSVSFSPKDQIIASANYDGTVKLWNTDGTLIKTLSGHEGAVLGVAFRSDGKTIASASADKTVKLWNIDGTLLKTLSGHEGAVLGVAFRSDGKTIASASADKTVKLWNTDGTLLKTLSGHQDAVVGVAFSPDGKTLASASADKTVILWNWQENLNLERLLTYGCDWMHDYLNNPSVNLSKSDRHLCDNIQKN
ncbi:WD-40 repeat-containing protein [Nostoc sp. HK-01]|nr:WD-40 repeat-containing protein [Nostoc sp. HK-01]